jgi:hypothetical protein
MGWVQNPENVNGGKEQLENAMRPSGYITAFKYLQRIP